MSRYQSAVHLAVPGRSVGNLGLELRKGSPLKFKFGWLILRREMNSVLENLKSEKRKS